MTSSISGSLPSLTSTNGSTSSASSAFDISSSKWHLSPWS